MGFKLVVFFHCLSMWPALLEAFVCVNPGMISVLILIFADTWADGLVLVCMRQSLLWSWSWFCSWRPNQAKFTTDIWSNTKTIWKRFLSMWVLCGSHVHVGSFMNNWLKELCLQKLHLAERKDGFQQQEIQAGLNIYLGKDSSILGRELDFHFSWTVIKNTITG